MHRLYITLTMCSIAISLQAQFKFEREYRIESNQVPSASVDFVAKLLEGHKVKWFKEESGEGLSYEAKTEYKNQKCSIEFDSTGYIQDIEIKIQWHQLAKPLRKRIRDFLKAEFDKYKMLKIQRQFSADPEYLLAYFHSEGKLSKQLDIKYEIELKGKKNGAYRMYECLFNAEGDFIRSAVIILDNLDNLEF